MGSLPTRPRAALFLTRLAVVLPIVTLAPAGPAAADPVPDDPQRQIELAADQLEPVIEQYNTTGERLAATQAQLSQVTDQLDRLGREVDTRRRRVSGLAADLYRSTGRAPITALLGTTSGKAVVDRLTLLDHLARDQRREIDAFATVSGRYQARQHTLTLLLREQTAQQQDLARRRALIEARIGQLEQLRRQAAASTRTDRSATRERTTAPAPAPRPSGADTGGAAGTAVRFAYQQLGRWYRFGSAGPDTYDCSGLTMAAWRTAGRSLPHSAAMQWNTVTHISRDQLRPGDLVFYFGDIHHVALYVGDGTVIHAPTTGQRVQLAPIGLASIHGYGRVG